MMDNGTTKQIITLLRLLNARKKFIRFLFQKFEFHVICTPNVMTYNKRMT